MAGFTMQVQSAMLPFVCTLKSGHPRIVRDVVLIRAGLARLPVINPMGEPNTPLAFWRRDECHLKQQAGHGKIAVRIGQNTKNFISFNRRIRSISCS